MKHLGRGYFVLLDSRENEVSERAWGDVWLAVEMPGRMNIILNPDATDKHGMVVLKACGHAWYHAVVLEDIGPLLMDPVNASVWEGDEFHINWNPMLDVMM